MKPKLFEKIRCVAGEIKAKKRIASFALMLVAIHLAQAQGMKSNKSVSTTRQVIRGVEGNKSAEALAQAPTATEILKAYGKLPPSFEANQGQIGPQVKFLSRGSGFRLFLTGNQAVLLLNRPDVSKREQPQTLSEMAEAKRTHARATSVLRIKLDAANPAPNTVGLDELVGKSNYFIGNDPEKWHTNIANYARVRYQEIYPGVDLVYYGNQGQLEHDFLVAPGANPKIIAMRFEGERRHKLAANGDLVLSIKGGEVRLQKPRIYQEIGGVQREVAGGYVLKSKREVGFAVAAYDTTRPLVIDPVLFYSTYLGGNSLDQGFGVAVDSSGNAYVTGQTSSPNFPTTSGAFQTSFGGNYDAFVTKLNATGSALVYSTYLGGNGLDQSVDGLGIALDSTGSAYVAGGTTSTNFPTTPGAFQTTLAGQFDAFVTKLNPTGSALVYSTYLGGSGTDECFGIAVDSAGSAYVTGGTRFGNFPTTSGAFQTIPGSSLVDAFVTKLNAAGSALVYSTYLGGSGDDFGFGIGVDSTGSAYVTGGITSTNFPTTSGAFQTTSGGSFDAFVTKLNVMGSALVYSTYLGGSGDDFASGIAVDSFSNAYLAGQTSSPNFPTTSGAFQTAFGGGSDDAFVTKLNVLGSALVYSSYLGGNLDDFGFGIAVDTLGNTYVTGGTFSTNFPITAGAFQTTSGGSEDAFVTKLNPPGTGLEYSSYLGGNGTDVGLGIAVDDMPNPNAYVNGSTSSANFPTTTGAFQTTSGGGNDAFVAKIANIVLPPGATSGKVTGGGSIDLSSSDFATFGFIAQAQLTSGEISGELQYVNHASKEKLHSVMFTTFVISGNMASFSGTCTQNGTPCVFRVDVEDNGESGKNDSFKISINGGPQEGGTLRSGNIQIHK
jgi:hypothetical protein